MEVNFVLGEDTMLVTVGMHMHTPCLSYPI